MPLPRDLSSSWSLLSFPLTQPREKDALLRLLQQAGVWNSSLQRIFDIVTNIGSEDGRRCKSVVLETQYVDRDYADAYSRLYGRSFHPYGKLCYRLHFFNKEFNSGDDLHIASYSEEKGRIEELRKDYLGFCVIRPSQPDTVGRTVIVPPRSSEHNQYVLCRNEYALNLAGLQLKANGSPFFEQDGMVGACATAAIWMAHMSLYKPRGLPTYSTTQITEIADATYPSPERVFPSSGLTVEQVGVALKRMGHETITVKLDKAYPKAARNWLYPYVESAIPIVLGVRTRGGRHAVVIVGHTLESLPLSEVTIVERKVGRGLQGLRYCSAAEWVDGFLLHDDQRGPYRVARVSTTGPASAPAVQIEDFPRHGRTTRFHLLAAIVPLPRHVYLLGEEAEAKGVLVLTLMKNLGLVDSQFDQQGLVIRTLLIESNDFKLSLDVAKRHTPPLLGWLYQKRHLPKYVWLIEVSKLPLWNVSPMQKRVVGEILIDPTSNPRHLDVIAVHLGEHFWAAEPGDPDIFGTLGREAVSIPNWNPYGCLTRLSS